jgi:large subunit ribosomal protein L33
MAKKTSIKVRLVPEAKPNSPFFYYLKKPNAGE